MGEEEVANEFKQWYPVKHAMAGREYYCHRQTGKTMWEDPVDVLLPGHFLRLKAMQLLCEDRIAALQVTTISPSRRSSTFPSSSSPEVGTSTVIHAGCDEAVLASAL